MRKRATEAAIPAYQQCEDGKGPAPVLRLVTRRESAAGALSEYQMMVLDQLDEIRQMVLAGEVDGMLYYCSGRKEAGGLSGRHACRGLDGDMDFVTAGMFLRCAIVAAGKGRM